MSSEEIPGVCTTHIPKHVIIGLVTSSAFNGKIDENPYNFQHFNVENVSLHVGPTTYPSSDYNLDFGNDLYMKAYKDLFDENGIFHGNTGTWISFSEFKEGYTFFVFDLTPDRCNGYHLHQTTSGDLRVRIRFRKALEQHVNMLVYTSYYNNVYINGERKATTDYRF